VIEDLTRMVTRMLIIAPILQLIQSLIPGGGGALSGANALSTTKLVPGGIFGNGVHLRQRHPALCSWRRGQQPHTVQVRQRWRRPIGPDGRGLARRRSCR